MTCKPGIGNNLIFKNMKERILLIAFAALALASCSKETSLSQENTDRQVCELTVNIHQESMPLTKTGNAFDTELEYEKAINSLQLFIFDTDGLIRHYCTVEKNNDAYKKTVTISAGEKHVWAVANYKDLSTIMTEDELKASVVKLEDNSTEADKGFVMADNQSVNLTGISASITLTLRRMVGRIALQSIKNSLPAAYGALTINRVFISNVVGNQNLNGDAEPVVWYNQEGRKDETPRNITHIIDGSTYKASCESLTFKNVNSGIDLGSSLDFDGDYVFYGMPNNESASPYGFMDQFAPQMTVLVVDASINGKTYYYPVVMSEGIMRNASYTVYLTITDLGSDDPNYPPLRGSLNVTVNVKEWDSEDNVIEEVI